MDGIVAATRFSKPIYEKAAKEFARSWRESAKRGGLGHQVGMSTHDVGQSDTLRPGMVFTIEPQFRVPEEKLYFRLEDLIVIGEAKAEVVSALARDGYRRHREGDAGAEGSCSDTARPEGLPAR